MMDTCTGRQGSPLDGLYGLGLKGGEWKLMWMFLDPNVLVPCSVSKEHLNRFSGADWGLRMSRNPLLGARAIADQ